MFLGSTSQLSAFRRTPFESYSPKRRSQSVETGASYACIDKIYSRTAKTQQANLEHVEMHHIHHIHHIRNSKEKEGFGRIMSLLNRKQIPVCKFHHKAIHDGRYHTISLSEFYDTRIAQVENSLALYSLQNSFEFHQQIEVPYSL